MLDLEWMIAFNLQYIYLHNIGSILERLAHLKTLSSGLLFHQYKTGIAFSG